jgi:multiple sugar transport system permease protein
MSLPRPALSKHLPAYLFMLPYVGSFTLFILVPFVVAGVLAFMQYDLTNREAGRFVFLRNFIEALTDPYFWKSLRATAYYAVLMVPASLGLSLLLALGLHSMTHGRNAVRAILFLPGMLNVAVVGILWQWFYNRDFGLLAFWLGKLGLPPIPFLSEPLLAMPAVVVMSLWWGVGGTTVVLLTGRQQIPTSVYEAAAIDGATPWQQFRLITLPMMRSVLIFSATMNTIAACQVFGQPFILTHGGPEFATRGVVQYIYETAFMQYRMGYGAAMSWLLFAIVAAIAIAQRRLLPGGLPGTKASSRGGK